MELKKCPFCGGKAKLASSVWKKWGSVKGDWVFVKCTMCGATGKSFLVQPLYDDPDYEQYKSRKENDAISSWNQRSLF